MTDYYRELDIYRLHDKGIRNGNYCFRFVVTDMKRGHSRKIIMAKNRWLPTMVVEMYEVANRYNVNVIHSKFGDEYRSVQ